MELEVSKPGGKLKADDRHIDLEQAGGSTSCAPLRTLDYRVAPLTTMAQIAHNAVCRC